MGFYRGPNIVRDGLVIALDMSSPRSYPGSGTTWYDLSGNGRDFTFSGTPTVGTSGPVKYWETSGGTATGPASNSVGINNTSGYTIIWVFKTPTGSTNGAFKFFGTGTYSRGIFVHPGWVSETDTIYFDQGGCCAGDTRTTYYNANINGGSLWNFAAVRRETGGSTRTIYYNGSVVSTNSAAAANIDLNSTAIELNPDDEGYNWVGYMANFLVYNRGLLDSELHQIYNGLKRRFNL